jgi:hypothetical protein
LVSVFLAGAEDSQQRLLLSYFLLFCKYFAELPDQDSNLD